MTVSLKMALTVSSSYQFSTAEIRRERRLGAADDEDVQYIRAVRIRSRLLLPRHAGLYVSHPHQYVNSATRPIRFTSPHFCQLGNCTVPALSTCLPIVCSFKFLREVLPPLGFRGFVDDKESGLEMATTLKEVHRRKNDYILLRHLTKGTHETFRRTIVGMTWSVSSLQPSLHMWIWSFIQNSALLKNLLSGYVASYSPSNSEQR